MSTKLHDKKYDKLFAKFEGVSDKDLKKMFWDRIAELMDPVIELGRTKTTPSVERSILLRMGFSSIEAASIVAKAVDADLMKYGVGHAVYITSKKQDVPIRDAGLLLMENKHWDEIEAWIKEGK